MKNILVLQTDNRDLDYLGLTKKLTKFTCKYMTENQIEFKDFNYNYLFVDMNKYKKEKMNPCTLKIYVLNDILNTSVSNTIDCTTSETIETITRIKTYSTTFKNKVLIEEYTDNEIPNVTTIIEKETIKKPNTKITVTNTNYDLVVFLDSDAWIQDFYNLHNLVLKTINSNENNTEPIIQGCYSRDPYIKKNTYINSGSFIIKINDYTKNMYKEIINKLENDDSHWDSHPYDQYYISNYIYENKKDFLIFKPPILNTPLGSILRHNWWKTHKMYSDLYNLLNYFHTNNIPKSSPEIDFENEIDNEIFPNPEEEGYIYFH